eukprot:10659321-Alexandrium_andersonii.AAC.1
MPTHVRRWRSGLVLEDVSVVHPRHPAECIAHGHALGMLFDFEDIEEKDDGHALSAASEAAQH